MLMYNLLKGYMNFLRDGKAKLRSEGVATWLQTDATKVSRAGQNEGPLLP